MSAHRSPAKLFAPAIVCSVLIYDPDYACTLHDVPILRKAAGLVDSEVWIPRAASISLLGGQLVTDGSGPIEPTVGAVTAPPNMDGDHVVVGFLNNDLAQPIILGQIDHPRNIRNPQNGVPPNYKLLTAVRGWRLGMLDSGDVDLDGTLASAGVVTPTIPPVETPDPNAGNVNIALNALAKVSIGLLTAPSATQEPVVLGTSFLTALNTLLTAELAAWTAVASAHTAAATAFTALSQSAAASAATAAATAATAAGSAVSTLQSSISASLSAGKPFLSIKLEVD